MRIALCAPLMEADLLERKLKDAVTDEKLVVDEYNNVDTMLKLTGISTYDAVWIAFSGATGMEAVIRVRGKSRDISIVWISDDEEFVSVGVGYRLAMFLTPNSSPEEFRIAVQNSRRRDKLC